MTPKERAAMQQALIYLDAIINGEGVKPYQLEGTAFTLREALDNSLKPRCFADYQPNHAIDRACASCAIADECQTGEQPVSQESSIDFDKLHAMNMQYVECPACGSDMARAYSPNQPVSQEPFGWYSDKGGFNECGEGQPLYAAPQPVNEVELTKTEVLTEAVEAGFMLHTGYGQGVNKMMPVSDSATLLDFARAVIAADREKNK